MTDTSAALSEKLAHYRERGARRVKLAVTDVDGVLRGKYVSLDKFASVLEKGGGFCDCIFGWDVDDALYDAGEFTGWHTGFPDARYRLLTESERWLAEEGCPLFLGEFVADGDDVAAHPICPRSRLRVLLERLDAQGLTLRSGFEYEFFVFRETPQSVRDKGYRGLTPLTPGNFGYSVLDLACDLEGLHCETGPGVWEGALSAVDGIAAADRAALFKTFAKVFFARQECLATFMAKWSMRYPGQSGHFHVSLVNREGQNAFHDAGSDHGMSAAKRHALGGLQTYLPELLVLLAPTVNSHTRLVKGAWAPTASTWGVENRTTALRVIPGGGSSQRIECRVGGADANPYLVAAGVVAAMLAGLEQRIEPTPPIAGNAYDVEATLPEALKFPSGLAAATERFAGSAVARQALGDAFVDHFAMTRRWEVAERDRHVDSWQLERYFEII